MADGARLSGLIGPQTGRTRHSPQHAGHLAHLDPISGGPLTLNQPIEIRSLTAPAARLRSFFDDFYNRIHISPRLIDFGFVASDVTRRLSVWNAFRGPATLDTITIASNNQLSLTGPTLPLTLQQFQAVSYDVTAAADGDPAIASTLTFNFSDRPVSLRLAVIGTRGEMWNYRPNWAESVSLDLEYKTDIFTSRSGKEQRRALRNEPRRRIEYTIGLHREKVREFERLMVRWQTRPLAMGDPTRQTLTATQLVELSDRVTVAEVPRWLKPTAAVMLESGDDRAIVVVASVDANGAVTLTSPAQRTWPAGTSIRPTVSGLLDAEVKQTNLTDELAEVAISFSVNPGSEPAVTTDAGLLIHAGREVFPFPENWSESIETSFRWDRELVDFGYGRRAVYTPTDFGLKVRRSSFLNVSPAQAREMRDFFQRMKGQQAEFYWSSGANDLPPAEALLIGGDTMRVRGRTTYDAFDGDTVHKAVAVRLTDDRLIYRTIITMYLSGGDTIIQFSQPWLSSMEVADIATVSWMNAARFASDQFTEEWMTSDVMQTSLAIQTLEDLPVENALPPYDGAAQWALEIWGSPSVAVFDRVNASVNTASFPSSFI